MRYLYLLLFSFCLLQAEEIFNISKSDITLSAECEPLTCVADCVNVQSGHYFQIDQDFVGNTIDPLHLIRFYDSGSSAESFLGSGFGSQYPIFASSLQEDNGNYYSMISEREGFMMPYRSKKKVYKIDTRIFRKGYTNFKVGNTHSNIAIRQATYDIFRTSPWELDLGNGTKRIYGQPIKMDSATIHVLELPTRHGFLLTEEKKANGNLVRYEYEIKNGKPLFSKITTYNRKGDSVLNSLTFEHHDNGCKLKSSCGRSVDYSQSPKHCFKSVKHSSRNVLNKVNYTFDDWIVYEIGSTDPNLKKFSRVGMVKKPCGYYQMVKYDSNDRVISLVEPSGEHGHGVISHRFEYLKYCTHVFDANGQRTTYNFDNNKRISSIDTFDQDKMIKQEVFEWDTESDQRGWLKSKSLKVANFIYHTTNYTYDDNGNVVKETLKGNLSGDHLDYFFDQNQNYVKTYTIEYTYSQDGRNLLLSKKTPEGLLTQYEYEMETNLITKKLVSYQGGIQERILCSYDSNGQIEKIIEDDGASSSPDDLSGVTYRKINIVTAVHEPGAAYGKPASIQQRMGKDQQLVKRIEFSYDLKGNEVSQKHFDASNTFCFETHKEYDHKNQILSITDALGQITHYAYDALGHKTEETEVGSGKSTHYSYDCMFRLADKTERHYNGETFVTAYKYNDLNQLISSTDCYNNETIYSYDRLGKVVEIKKPLIFNEYDQATALIVKKKYSLLGLVEEVDENGNKTIYKNNIYGQPAHIIYPDNSQEWNTYYPSGLLKQKKYADCSYREYEYDSRGHLLHDCLFDQKNKILSNEFYTYKGKLLTSSTNTLGLKTFYVYDAAGRKISETTATKATQYKYDSFDRIVEIIQGPGENKKHEILTYDWLDRIISKTFKDTQGSLYFQETYGYDRQGNQHLIVKNVSDNKQAIYHSHYNSDGTLAAKFDPLNNKKEWEHDHHFINQNGQMVHAKKIMDPLGRYVLEEKDAYQRIAKKSIFENDKLYSVTSYYYDALGHEVKQMTEVRAEGTPLREYGIASTYNKQGLLASQTELPSHKTTRFEYNFVGDLTQKIKPDGIVIVYTYDGLGRVLTINSSDGSISYNFKYDLNTGPIEIKDNLLNTVQKREYDQFDRLIKEEYNPSTILEYCYDAYDRLIELTLPDHSSIIYEYNPYQLKQIKRISASGDQPYVVECSSYDKNGNLLVLKNPAGNTHYNYDLLNRPEGIASFNWSSSLTFDAIGNLKKLRQSDLLGIFEKEMDYDRLNHLIKEPLQEYIYDTLGNCIQKNGQPLEINSANQLTKYDSCTYTYDANGNLIYQSEPSTTYKYDAFNRLITLTKDNRKVNFTYDYNGRLLSSEPGQQYIYQAYQEIGSLVNGKFVELRLLHPDPCQDKTFAIELNGEVYFPIQDFRGNICALRSKSRHIVKSYRYSAFGEESSAGNPGIESPWRFANRRQLEDLTLFTHRFYNQKIMRWLTTDPAGFGQGLNLYTYNRNNPYYYTDPDGQFVFAIPLFSFAFSGAAITATAVSLEYLAYALVCCGISYEVYVISEKMDHNAQSAANEQAVLEEEKKNKDEKKIGAKPSKTKKKTNKGEQDTWYEPRTLEEKLTMDEAKGGDVGLEIMKNKIKDPNYPPGIWEKRSHKHKYPQEKNLNNIEVHWWHHLSTGMGKDYKFKGELNENPMPF